jgi:hypothetical protein
MQVQVKVIHRYTEVLQTLNECVMACEELVRQGFSPPASLLTMDRATVLRWADWSPMLERNPDLADTWLSLCAKTCKSWAEAYRYHPAEAAQACVQACERCIEACQKALQPQPTKGRETGERGAELGL